MIRDSGSVIPNLYASYGSHDKKLKKFSLFVVHPACVCVAKMQGISKIWMARYDIIFFYVDIWSSLPPINIFKHLH